MSDEGQELVNQEIDKTRIEKAKHNPSFDDIDN